MSSQQTQNSVPENLTVILPSQKTGNGFLSESSDDGDDNDSQNYENNPPDVTASTGINQSTSDEISSENQKTQLEMAEQMQVAEINSIPGQSIYIYVENDHVMNVTEGEINCELQQDHLIIEQSVASNSANVQSESMIQGAGIDPVSQAVSESNVDDDRFLLFSIDEATNNILLKVNNAASSETDQSTSGRDKTSGDISTKEHQTQTEITEQGDTQNSVENMIDIVEMNSTSGQMVEYSKIEDNYIISMSSGEMICEEQQSQPIAEQSDASNPANIQPESMIQDEEIVAVSGSAFESNVEGDCSISISDDEEIIIDISSDSDDDDTTNTDENIPKKTHVRAMRVLMMVILCIKFKDTNFNSFLSGPTN